MRSVALRCALAACLTALTAPSPAQKTSPDGLKGEQSLPSRYKYVVQDVLRHCKPNKGFWVDLGAGKGPVALALIEAAGNPVVMVDPDKEAMAEGLQTARGKGVADRLSAVVGTAEDLPFPDNSVDLVVSRGSIFFWEDPVKGLQEVYRVLRPGGKAYIGGGAGSGYPETAARKLIQQRQEKMKGEEAEKWKRFVDLRRPEQMHQWAKDAKLPDYQVMGKGAISAEDPRVGQGVWLLIQKKAESSDSPADRVEELVRREMERQGIPGLSLAVVRDGQVVLASGFGLADVERNVRATAETVYQIQSLTKSFTATGIMMLVEQGHVGLDDKIGQHLSVPTDRWKNITVRHLLTHTSGIKDFINDPTASLRLDVTEDEVLKAAARRPLSFQPGEQYAYSNTNYHLLAMIVRKVTGKSYGEFLRERIFAPLAMDQTRVISLSDIIPNRAAGYRRERGSLRNGEFVAPTILGYGGGGLRSTVLDLAKWDAALYTEKLLKQSSLEQMWTRAKLNSGKPTGYGFGWGIGEVRGHRCLSHTGSHATGFATAICRFVDDKVTVIALTNCNGASPSGIAQRIARLYVPGLGPLGPGPPEVKKPAAPQAAAKGSKS